MTSCKCNTDLYFLVFFNAQGQPTIVVTALSLISRVLTQVSTEGAADKDCCALVVDVVAAAAVGVEDSPTISVKTHSPWRGSFSSSKQREVHYVIRSTDIFVSSKDREGSTVLRILIIMHVSCVCVSERERERERERWNFISVCISIDYYKL